MNVIRLLPFKHISLPSSHLKALRNLSEVEMECELTEMNMGLNSVRHVREEKKGGGDDTKRERGGVDGRGREGVGGGEKGNARGEAALAIVVGQGETSSSTERISLLSLWQSHYCPEAYSEVSSSVLY